MSPREELLKSWERTRKHLSRAAVLLTSNVVESDDGGRVDRFSEFLDANELQLALDELEGLGQNNGVERAYWEHLLAAAVEMNLTAHASRIQERLHDGHG